jgi:hypothetical protein
MSCETSLSSNTQSSVRTNWARWAIFTSTVILESCIEGVWRVHAQETSSNMMVPVVQGVLERVQAQLHQQRLKRALSQTRGQHVDIQIGFNVYLDVPQEMRSRLWLVILQEPSLAVPFQVCSQRACTTCMREKFAA